jgi:hypothetical protein
MLEGTTNHELASEMGFSVSTLRHETMLIYLTLAVSDRKAAAKKAIMLTLIYFRHAQTLNNDFTLASPVD